MTGTFGVHSVLEFLIVHHPQRRIMRFKEVSAATGYGRTWIYMLEREGKFPKSRKIGARSVGWDSQEVENWIAEKLA